MKEYFKELKIPFKIGLVGFIYGIACQMLINNNEILFFILFFIASLIIYKPLMYYDNKIKNNKLGGK